MSIIIKGMDMPIECGNCDFFREDYGVPYCFITEKHIYFIGEIADFCPLIEIVTCKDCKHRFYEDMCDCIDILPGTEDDFFCPYGERRADE